MRRNIFLSLLLTLCLASCKNMISMNDLDKGNVNVQLPGAYSARTIGEEPEDPLSIEYTVNLSKLADESLTTKTGKPGDLITFEELEPGKYNVSIKYESNIFLLAGETQVEVQAGKTAEAKVTLKDAAVFSDPHVTVEQSPEYGFKFIIKRLETDIYKTWGSVQLFNYTYNIGIENVEKADNIDEVVFYWPFAEKGKKYIFTFGNSRDGEWASSQISVVSEVTTNYKLNLDKLNYFYDNCKAEVTGKNSIYNLKLSGCTLKDIRDIYPFEIESGYINLSVWGANSETSIGDCWSAGGDYYYETENPFNTDIEITELMNNAINSYNWPLNTYEYKRLWAAPCLYTETFPEQVFEFNAIVSDNIDLNLPTKASAKHFKAEKVDNGIKVTLLKDKNSKYCYENGDSIQVLDEYNQYGFVYDKSVLDVLESEGEYSIIWPFAKEGDFITLTLGYYLENDVNNECKHEYISVESGNGECYTQGKDFDYSDMFTMDSDDSGTNSKRIIKSKVPYSDILSRVPANYKEESLGADITFWSSDSNNPWDWTHNREWLGGFNGSFNTLNALSEPDWNDNNYYISQLFNNGFDMAALAVTKCLWYDNLWDVKIKGQYVIPVFNVSFDIKNYDVKGRFEVINHTGVLNYTKIKHPNVYAEECDEGIKFTVTKTSENFNDVSIKDENNNVQMKKNNIDYDHFEIGWSYELIDKLVTQNTTYKFHLEGTFGNEPSWRIDDEIIEFTYKGNSKGSLDSTIYDYYNSDALYAKIEYEKGNVYNDIVLNVYSENDQIDLSKIIQFNDFTYEELDYHFRALLWDSTKNVTGGFTIPEDYIGNLMERGIDLVYINTYIENNYGYWTVYGGMDIITLLANCGTNYFEFNLAVTVDDVEYNLPGLTNMWDDDTDCFEFTEYPNNMNGILNIDGLFFDSVTDVTGINNDNYSYIPETNRYQINDKDLFSIFIVDVNEEGEDVSKVIYGRFNDAGIE